LRSHVHVAGAALAAGRLLGLDASRMTHALAIALYQAPRATVPGFMAPDSKLLTAAEPTVTGLRAARLAAAGVTGPLDALEHREGFLAAFADAPLPGMLGGLGTGWATRTLCVKPYPGCAYLDTTVDALLELGPPPAEDVREVVVEASLLTHEMDRMSRPYASVSGAGVPTPVTINFSVPWNVAVTLVAGELAPATPSKAPSPSAGRSSRHTAPGCGATGAPTPSPRPSTPTKTPSGATCRGRRSLPRTWSVRRGV